MRKIRQNLIYTADLNRKGFYENENRNASVRRKTSRDQESMRINIYNTYNIRIKYI